MKKRENNYNYREATSADIKQLQELGLNAYGQFKSVLSDESWQKMAATCGDAGTYVNLLRIARSFVCETGDKIVGMAFLIPSGNPMAFFEKDWSYIRLLGVDPEHEGQGIGRELAKMCIGYAKLSEEKIIVLHTSEFQNAARHIYEDLGFKVLKELDPIYNKKYWLYHLDLNPEVPSICYHEANLSDLQTIVNLRIEFAIELNGPQPTAAVAELRKQLENYFSVALSNQTCIFYLAKSDDKIVGMGGMLFREMPGNFKNPSGKWGYLMNMYTVRRFRRKGICAHILNLLVEAGSRAGLGALELHATTEGEHVYKQHGFHLHDEPTYRKFRNAET